MQILTTIQEGNDVFFIIIYTVLHIMLGEMAKRQNGEMAKRRNGNIFQFCKREKEMYVSNVLNLQKLSFRI